MFQPIFKYTDELVENILMIERYKTELEFLYLPTRVRQELIYKAKVKKTHFSTSIEGNILSYDQVEKAISEKGKKTKINSEREVINYWNALTFLEESKEENKNINLDFILELHGIIERKNVRQKIIGFRKPTPPGVLFAVYDSVNKMLEYIPPEACDVELLIHELVNWYNDNNNLPVAIKAAIVHYQFVTIHPFEDGNGRTSRALSTYILMKEGYDFKGFNSMEEYYANDLDGYYRSLQMGLPVLYYDGRNNPPNLEIWIEYFTYIMKLNAEKIAELARKANHNEEESLDLIMLNKKDKKMLRYVLESKKDEIKTKELSEIFRVTPRAISKWCSEWIARDILSANYKNVRITSYSLSDKYKKITFKDLGFLDDDE